MAANIELLSIYGIHFQDQKFEILNRWLDNIQKRQAPECAVFGEKANGCKGSILKFENNNLNLLPLVENTSKLFYNMSYYGKERTPKEHGWS